jgi:hypothetical protein
MVAGGWRTVSSSDGLDRGHQVREVRLPTRDSRQELRNLAVALRGLLFEPPNPLVVLPVDHSIK